MQNEINPKEQGKIKFMALVKKHPDSTINEVAKIMGLNRSTITGYAGELVQSGMMVISGKRSKSNLLRVSNVTTPCELLARRWA